MGRTKQTARKCSFHEEILSIHKKRLADKEASAKLRLSEEQKKASESAHEQHARDTVARLMPLPPYTPESELAAEAVEALENELINNKLHHPFGGASIVFGCVVHAPAVENRNKPNTLADFPGWPKKWPDGMTARSIGYYAEQCAQQLVDAFVAQNPEWKSDGVAPSISVFGQTIYFNWAH
jgi:hypothetical protein